MSSICGSTLKVAVWGQSHSAAIGVTIDGLPAGHRIDLEELQAFLDRRAPGRGDYATPRKEADAPEILSGLAESLTCGAPLTALIRNTNTRSGDYAELRDCPRPGHADYTAQLKYGGAQDAAGGGHFSGRLTAPLCIAGGICRQILAESGVRIGSHILEIAGIRDRNFDPMTPELELLTGKSFPVLEDGAGEEMRQAIAKAKAQGDSVGGIIECAALGVPPALGRGIFGGMESRLSAIVFGIPAVKGLEFGEGFRAARLLGSEDNDPYRVEEGQIRPQSNHAGGILGGITNGMPLIFRAAVKPTPSISREQDSVSLSRLENETLRVRGRHDPCIVPRAVPCMEAAMAIGILDALLERDGLG